MSKPATARLERATDRDWHAMFGFAAPPEWFGYVMRTPWLRLGIGGAWRDADGRWWMFLERAPSVRMTLAAHKAAKRVLDELGDVAVYAMGDPERAGACTWIERLGFAPTDESRDGIRVWGRNTQP